MGDNTGSIHKRSVTIFEQISEGLIEDTFTAPAATTLKQGEAVKITGDNEVGPLVAPTDLPIGHVMNGGLAGEEVAVAVNYVLRVKGYNNSGGSIPAGSYVRQVLPQVQTDEKYHYAIAASATVATGIALCTSADQTNIKVGVLPTAILLP